MDGKQITKSTTYKPDPTKSDKWNDKEVMDILKEYRAWQNEQKEICGGSWVDTNRLFTKWNGEPLAATAPAYFLNT
ncbi:MAG: hypothetical protein FWE14_07500 [Lachnospiraceae bacterium]|nr:hypothetical protein [Lachnospiraceae bacterium]